MKSLLDDLSKEEQWNDYFAEKIERNQLNRKEAKQLASFIEQKRYLPITDHFSFSYPEKKLISRSGSKKKRIIYAFSEDENQVLKLLAHKLYRYDDQLSDNCYSFRRHKTAKTVFDDIRKIRNLDEKYVLKADIHDYFNSIDCDLLITIINEVINDDEQLKQLLVRLLKQDRCYFNGELIEEKRGAMAGVPLASFFANLYLKDVDEFYRESNIPYFRYSDDIIMFFDDEKTLQEQFAILRKKIEDKHLLLNEEKSMVIKPHERWEYLGFSYKEGKIDLSAMTIRKMKGKIRRKAQLICRKAQKKKLSYDQAARAMISSFDHKFYDLSGDNSFTWTRFYFPLLNSSEGLHVIDEYMLKYLRYLYSGRHYKGNYVITYERLKKLGYTPLVAELYRWKDENQKLNEKQRKTI